MSELNELYDKIKKIIFSADKKTLEKTLDDNYEKFKKILIKNKSLIVKNKLGKFYVFTIKTELDLMLLLLYSMFYYILSKLSEEKMIIGLDFEFTEQKIALCQIGFFPNKRFKYIFILNPKILQNDNDKEKIFINTIFTSDIYRITHGAESLDIPYVYNELLKGNKEDIFNFTKTMIDTRFLCEYYKIYYMTNDKKCSIYDALLFFNVINKNTYDKLNKLTEIMGPVQDVQWNISKMSSYHLKYVLYDVLYLKKFVTTIFKLSLKKDEMLYQQIKYISSINRFICYEKYDISNILNETKNIVDPMNNYIVESRMIQRDDTSSYKSQSQQKTLIFIYNQIIENIVISSLGLKVSKLLEINNFKKGLTLLFKRIIYATIAEKHVIYENKKQKMKNKIEYKSIFQKMAHLKLEKLETLLEKFADSVRTNMTNII